MATTNLQATSTPIKKAPWSSLLKACERCRRRKIRCDEFFPCASCTRLGVQCRMPPNKRESEKSQSYLEERVKRLESLLAQQEGRGDGFHSVPMTPIPSTGGPSNLRLQIPTPPDFSVSIESGESSATILDLYESQGSMNRPTSYCSSPVDFPSSATGDLSPWSSDALEGDQTSFPGFINRPRRSHSFPFMGGNQHSESNTAFNFSINQDNNLLSPDIPTIEVTSWDTQSNIYTEGMNNPNLNIPNLAVDSWDCLSSPSLTALSSLGYGQDDDLLSEIDMRPYSRRSSMAFSECSFDGFDSLKCTAPVPTSSPSLLPSNCSIFPKTNYLQTSFHSRPSESTPNRPSLVPEQALSSQLALGNEEMAYARTFFEHIHPYFPVLSPQTFQSYSSPSKLQSELSHNPEITSILLIVAIGSQFQCNLGRVASDTPANYFAMAQQASTSGEWCSPQSLVNIQSNLLLALYTILSISDVQNPTQNLWMLNAFVAASCIDLNLHQRSADLDGADMSAFYSAYVLDRTVGTILGKPNALRDGDISVDGLRRTQEGVESRRRKLQSAGAVSEGYKNTLGWYRLGIL